MNEKKIRTAETIIKVSSLLRLSWNALLALCLAYSYTYPGYIMKMYNHSSRLFIIIPVFALDFFLTLKWFSSPKLYKLHITLYFFLGGIFYVFYVIDLLSISSSNPYDMSGAIISAALIWGIGMIPFAVAEIGRNSLARAMYWKNKAEQGQEEQLTGDKNE